MLLGKFAWTLCLFNIITFTKGQEETETEDVQPDLSGAEAGFPSESDSQHGLRIVDSDILVDASEVEVDEENELVFTASSMFRNAMTSYNNRWPNGVVTYKIYDGYDLWVKDTILSSMEQLANDTAYQGNPCITFKERTTETNYVEIMNNSGCYSRVGVQSGMQPLSIGTGCERKGTIMHELIHTLGFWHEHSRADRNYYVTVNWTNIKEGHSGNFQKFTSATINHQNLPYDYESIMHYSAYSFAKSYGYPTITALLPHNGYMGQRSYLSDVDINELRTFYGCAGSYPMSYTLPPTTTTPAPTVPPPIDGVLEQLWSCGFESGDCSFANETGSLYWIRHTGSTPSSRTGPIKDHTTGLGYYKYTEASSNYGAVYTMISKRWGKQDVCVDFWYHMYSSNEGTENNHVGPLKVFVRSGGKDSLVWEMSRSQGPDWNNGRFQITVADHMPGKKFKLVFEGSILQSYKSDIAVDDITLYKGICP